MSSNSSSASRPSLVVVACRGSLTPLPRTATGTLFAEIDVHSAATLAKAGDAESARAMKVTDVWVVFKTHFDIGYTDTIEQVAFVQGSGFPQFGQAAGLG